MEIYVQSRGRSQDQDYCWLKITENGQHRQDPSLLKEIIPETPGTRVYEMIDSTAPSIILVRFQQQLLLLVTALKAQSERTDFMNRQIRNSVAWIYPDSDENEKKVRSLAIQALQGELEKEVAEAVTSGDEYGFVVSFDQMSQLAQPEKIDSLPTDLKSRIAGNFIELRKGLASELGRYRLPSRLGLLAIITSIKSASALKQVNVWRGLSNRVDSKEWQKITTSSQDNQEQFQQKKSLRMILIAIATGIMIIAMTLLLTQFIIPQSPQPQPERTPTTSISQEM